MPTPEIHAAAAKGVVAAVIAFTFDVPEPVVFAGFIGAWVGLALSPRCSYITGLIVIIAGTVAAAFATPILTHHLGDYPARGIAFFGALASVALRTQILDAVRAKLAGVGK